MTGRTPLPNRRLQIAETIDWRGITWLLGIGFDHDGFAREVFLDGVKTGQDYEALLDDACILASLAMQAKVPAAEIAATLGREGISPGDEFASPVGMIAHRVAAVERDQQPAIQLAYASVRRAAE
jgi:hypothetical protein